MSFLNHSLTVSIQKLQDLDNPFDLDHITCSFFINSRPFGVLKAPDFSSSIFIPHILPKDTVQFIFYKNDHQELYGCISFTAKQLLESQEENIQQWATLFDDPEDDMFDGKIGEDDEELPRALLHVTVKKQESLIPPEDESQIHFELGLKEKGFETNLQQTLDFSSVACVPRYDEHFQKSCDISLISTHNHKILESPEKGPMNIAAVNIEEIQMDLVGSKCPIALERKSSLGSHNPTENSIDDLMVQNENSEIEVQNAQDRATYTTIESTTIMDSKRRLKASLSLNESNLKDFVKMNDCTLPKRLQLSTTQSNIQAECQCDKRIKETEHLNINLEAKVDELQSLVEKLQSDNNLLHQKEGLHVVGFNAMKSELDTCKSAKEGLEKRIAEYEELLNTEKESRTQFEKLAKEKENESLLANQELTTLRSQVNLDETVIQNLQKEIFSLRQKEDESLELNIKLVGTTQKIDYYEEKLGALIESISIFNIAKTDTQTLEEFVDKVQELMPLKVKEMEDMKSMNEDLTIRLSICDNKLLADSLLAQIDGLKNTITSLEKERESLKEELNKVTANYMQITTKYMELSDFVTTKKPAQPEQSTTLARSSTPNLKRSNNSKPVLKNESVDDIEAKLIEFTVNHKIQSSLLTRIEYGVYLYGGKKVYLKLQDGQLVVKVGDSYKPFQDFLKPKNSVSSTSTPGTNNNGSKSNPKNLKLSLKETSREERSFDKKLQLKMSNYHSVQVDHSQRDLSADISGTSRSICKENTRGLVRQLYQTNSTVLDLHNNSMKTLTRLDSNLKLKEILTSRMVDRRLSYGILYKKDKSQRDLTPL